ncbi:MAG: SHOCT domain-containing protein [Bacteroidales bacterium]|jgi:putative membrane protein|nr:SHOCT domain-containing protein [Bacteroidales bacterium]NCU34454.1 SHOCT domain-containing protein [Candidatus Falkowbacteria bacterium]MDD2631145.1 SHOCT domain-containing protein [Bacteroidales bacterium]MDD3130388.1 SHOCT domain-containing protein [Bacteroidales bacterium]MDD3525644.1 SHOCT domain-containing protein [Bacteroidales bacterium]
MMDGYGNHGWGMGMGMGWWWVIGVAILVAIIWFAAKAVNKNNGPQLPPSRSPLDILKERYARGEIDKAEFEDRKRDLM